MSIIIVKGSCKKGQIFCQTSSYKKGRMEYTILLLFGTLAWYSGTCCNTVLVHMA
jgi:hypothetical protein